MNAQKLKDLIRIKRSNLMFHPFYTMKYGPSPELFDMYNNSKMNKKDRKELDDFIFELNYLEDLVAQFNALPWYKKMFID